MARLTDKIDKGYVHIAIYVVATVALAYGACMVLKYSGGFFTKFWALITAVLLPMVYGAMISYLLHPVVVSVCDRVERTDFGKADHKRTWGLSVAITMVIVAVVILAILAVLLLMVTKSLSGISIEGIKGLLQDTMGDLEAFMDNAQEAAAELGISTEWIKNAAAGIVTGVKDFFSTALFSVIFCVYFLLDGTRVIAYGKRVVNALVGDKLNDGAERIVADADTVFSGYIRGQFIDAFIVGALAAVLFTLFGVPYGAVAGMLMGIGNLIPYLGTPMGVISVVLVCVAQGAWQSMALGLAAILVIGFVDGNIVNPRLLSQSVDVHPLLVMAALIAGGAIGGIAGMLVAVPVAAFLKVQLDRWLEARESEELTEAEGPVGEGLDEQDALAD